MAKQSVKLDAGNLKEMLGRFEEMTGKPMGDIVRSHARLCAVELANRTQPFTGGGKGGRETLERNKAYLRKDLLRVVKDKAKLEEKADMIEDAKLQTRLRNAVNGGNPATLAAVLKACGIIKDASNLHMVNGSGIGDTHIKHRSKRTGRTLSPRQEIYFAKTGFDAYWKQISKRLQYAKSGWAECARKIGGIKGDGARGIPASAKRHKGKNGKISPHFDVKKNPHVIMTNTTHYVSRLCKEGVMVDSVEIAGKKMAKAIQKAFDYLAKGGRNVRSITKEEAT